MIQQILDNLFDDSNIKEKDQVNYLVLCDYYECSKDCRTFKNKHFKKLKKKFKKEVDNA